MIKILFLFLFSFLWASDGTILTINNRTYSLHDFFSRYPKKQRERADSLQKEKIADEPLDFGVASSMSVAAMITLARNINVLLKGRGMNSEEQSKLLKDGSIAAGVAGIISLLIG